MYILTCLLYLCKQFCSLHTHVSQAQGPCLQLRQTCTDIQEQNTDFTKRYLTYSSDAINCRILHVNLIREPMSKKDQRVLPDQLNSMKKGREACCQQQLISGLPYLANPGKSRRCAHSHASTLPVL